MLKYREVLEYNKKCCNEYLEKYKGAVQTLYRQKSESAIEAIDKHELINEDEKTNKNKRVSNESISDVLFEENIDLNNINNKLSIIPGKIKDLLKILVCRRVKIVLNAHQSPQMVKIRDVVGDILVAETDTGTEENSIKFIDINCICEILISHEELLESILNL